MKVAIIGTVPSSKRVAPYTDNEWEIWVCSPGNSQEGAPPRISRWYELHSITDMLGAENAGWCGKYFAWLTANAEKFPIFMQERNPHVPAAQPFQRAPLMERWGERPAAHRTNWFTSSIAWMIAQALQEMRPDGRIEPNGDEIGIFGVDMAATEEHYSWQKAGIHRFIEIAYELGVPVTIPLESTLSFGCPVYGYAESSRIGRAMLVREMEMKERIGQIETQMRELEKQSLFFRGALEQVQFERRTFVSGNHDAEVDFEEAMAAAVKAPVEAQPLTLAGSGPGHAAAAAHHHMPSPDDFEGPGAELLSGKRAMNGTGEPIKQWPREPRLQPTLDVTEQG